MPDMIPAAHPIIGEAEVEAVATVLRSGMLTQGAEVAAFEKEFAAALVGQGECIAVNSGTSALHLGLLAAGIGPGDEVIVPSFTFAATANAVAMTGATPVFADIDPATFCMDPASAQAVITHRTSAIMPVHLYGHPADMNALEALAATHGLLLIEDAAQAHGASLNGRRAGSFGAFGAFSLYPTKNMTSGEGGMVSTCDADIARRVRLLRNQGMRTRYENELIGLNNRMTDIHAAIGRVQLHNIDAWTRRRQENAAFLTENLRGVITPTIAPGAAHVFHQYTIRCAGDRDRFVEELRDVWRIGSGVYYPIPLHRLLPLQRFASSADLAQTDRAAGEVVSLPVHPALTMADLERIVTAVNAIARAGA